MRRSAAATSAWTMTSPRRQPGNVASRCSSTGTATLYGRLATTAVGVGRQLGDAHGVGGDDVSRSARSGSRSATVRGSSPASSSSISTATTRSATSSRPSVSEPSPGPTSSTTSSGPTPETATMRRTVLASTTKFCPRCLVGRRSRRAAISRIERGSRRLTGPVRRPPGVARGSGADVGVRRRTSCCSPEPLRTRSATAICGGLALLVRHARAAVRAPGRQRELQPAVVAVAGVDRPVATRLARGDLVPQTHVRDSRLGRGLGADDHDAVHGLAGDDAAGRLAAHHLAVVRHHAVGRGAGALA